MTKRLSACPNSQNSFLSDGSAIKRCTASQDEQKDNEVTANIKRSLIHALQHLQLCSDAHQVMQQRLPTEAEFCATCGGCWRRGISTMGDVLLRSQSRARARLRVETDETGHQLVTAEAE